VSNARGTPIWYELITPDLEAATRFYGAVVGWTGRNYEGSDYHLFESDGGQAGGAMALSAEMASGGAKPGWLMYLGSTDVDADIALAGQAGGATWWGPTDLPGVGRAALLADPQGNPFYVMKPATEGGTSTVFAMDRPGRCAWNELGSTDAPDAIRFFGEVFGWHVGGSMPMGDLGEYSFLHAGEQVLGGCMPAAPGTPGGWIFYFRVPDLDASAAAVRTGGGEVMAGPMDVPGNDRIVVARDPQGAVFGLVARAAQE
jgi:uncharacterized protein